MADLHVWAGSGDLPFYRAAREVPPTMRERLPGQYQELLEPQNLLDAQALQQRILEAATLLRNEFGMVMPPLNHSLVLFRWLQELMLPLEVYAVTLRLAGMMEVEHKFIVAPRVGLSRVLRYPEAQLMALTVVATKLLFPTDDVERYPKTASDPAALSLDWKAWTTAQQKNTSTRTSNPATESEPLGLYFTAAFSMQESDCLAASNDKLDDYLDWYADNIASENVKTQGRVGRDAEFRHALFRFFPISHGRRKQNDSNCSAATSGDAEPGSQNAAQQTVTEPKFTALQTVQASLQPRHVVSDATLGMRHIARPGDFYRRYRNAEALHEAASEEQGQIGGKALLLLYQRTAELSALSLEGIVKAVFAVERRLEKIQVEGSMGRAS